MSRYGQDPCHPVVRQQALSAIEQSVALGMSTNLLLPEFTNAIRDLADVGALT